MTVLGPLIHRQPDLLAELVDFARSESPKEACGLISRGEGGIRLRRAENGSYDPLTSFAILPRDQFRLIDEIGRSGEELVGLFHSHPRSAAEMSERDREVAKRWPGLEWVIVGFPDGDPALWVGQP